MICQMNQSQVAPVRRSAHEVPQFESLVGGILDRSWLGGHVLSRRIEATPADSLRDEALSR